VIPPPVLLGSRPRDFKMNMSGNNFFSMHNTSENHVLNTSQSLWINERSIMEKNE
jgi:hypothetical protein